MSNFLFNKRTFVCSASGIVSGLFGCYLGGQIGMASSISRCDRHPIGLSTLCQAWTAPGAIWQGSTTGLWVGAILGGFLGGVATSKQGDETSEVSSENPEEAIAPPLLSAARAEAFSASESGRATETVSFDLLQCWIEAARKEQPFAHQTLTVEEARQIMVRLGFSSGAIARCTQRSEREERFPYEKIAPTPEQKFERGNSEGS